MKSTKGCVFISSVAMFEQALKFSSYIFTYSFYIAEACWLHLCVHGARASFPNEGELRRSIGVLETDLENI